MAFNLERRYAFSGTIVFTTAMHIGGGRGQFSASDSPLVRTPDGVPFIPGSSFKGAFRSTVEKLAGSIPGVRSCALQAGSGCIGAQGPAQRSFNTRRESERWDDKTLLAELEQALCDTCRLFGSPYRAAQLVCNDLYLTGGSDPVTQVRDGVGIDRDSECAVPRIKYDLEIVESDISFSLRLQLENPSDLDLQLTCVGLAEFMSGFASLGGMRSRGLGRCQLEDLQVAVLDLSAPDTSLSRLRDYLTGAAKGLPLERRMAAVADTSAFLTTHIDSLLERGATRA